MPGAPVKIWLIGPGQAAITDQALLGATERARALRMAAPYLRDRFIRRRALLRMILAREIGITDAADLTFGEAPGGKPVLNGSSLQFNLSTSGDEIAIAVAARPVGIDIERGRSVEGAIRLAERFFHADEAAALRAVPADRREAWFLTCWARKEAVVKAHGAGLRLLADFAIGGAPLGREAARVTLDGRAFAVADLERLPAGCFGAVALEGAALVVTFETELPR
ncbi:MAG: 4'-phosphopantetheinyl transferase superfamily protein [Proteobacteria bacterium]|nr:4'-phosphopantetheinyl transferase superfamily protein [Pseudomonadota bacterium]